MATDVVGYSRLMGANEVGTLKSLREHDADLESIREHPRYASLLEAGS